MDEQQGRTHTGGWHPFQHHMIAAVYRHENQALRVIEWAIEHDFLMDRMAIMGKRLSKGDDLLGIYYPSPKEKMKVWAVRGTAFGAIWGLMAGIAGVYLSPGENAFGDDVVRALGAAVGYGAVVGGSMAAAAGFSGLASALHRMGVPRDQFSALKQAVSADKYVILLHGSREEIERVRFRIEHSGAETFFDFPMDRMPL